MASDSSSERPGASGAEGDDWLRRLSPDEWIRAALGELSRAERALASRDVRAGIAFCKRGAGMALNAVLLVRPNDGWGRSYVEHVAALVRDDEAPAAVREAARAVHEAQPPTAGAAIPLHTPGSLARLVEAAKDVVAHAYYVVGKHAARGDR